MSRTRLRSDQRPVNPKTRMGLSLLELTVALMILAALAGLLIARLDSAGDSAASTATQTSLTELRNGFLRYWQDVKHAAPVRSVLIPSVVSSDSLHVVIQTRALLENPDLDRNAIDFDFVDYDPATGIGWRGPYVSGNPTRYRYIAGNAPDGSFADDDGFTLDYGGAMDPYGQPNDLTVRDHFRSIRTLGRPIVFQAVPIVFNGQLVTIHVRAISAGENGVLEIPRNLTNEQLGQSANSNLVGDDIYVAFEVRP